MWAIPVGIVFAVLLGALVYFVAKSRRMQRSFYRLVRRDSFDHGVTYNAGKRTILSSTVSCILTAMKFCTTLDNTTPSVACT